MRDLPRSRIGNLIDEWIFNERDRSILKRRLLDGRTFPQLAGEFELSERRIKTIVYKSEQTLFAHIDQGD